MLYRIFVPCATDDEDKLEEHVKNYPKYREARKHLLKAGKRPEVDLVYLHWDGDRANENVHFKKLNKEESMKIWTERRKKDGKNRPQPLSQQPL